MGTGRVLRCSSGPEPFPGIPIKEPLQPQEPGEVLIRYELEAAPQLNRLGWCCFGTLCCVALPLSWLPFACDFCKQQYQRPVYGYPMDCLTVSFITAAEDAWSTHKASTDAPTIHCMDATIVEPLTAVQDQQQQQQQWQHKPDTLAQLRVRCTPSPPPSSIFIPPSAVPACGFTADNPFPSRYSEYSPAGSTGSRAVLTVGSLCTRALACHSPCKPLHPAQVQGCP